LITSRTFTTPPSRCATLATAAGTSIRPSPSTAWTKPWAIPAPSCRSFVFCGGITGTTVAFILQTVTQTNFWGQTLGLKFVEDIVETYPTVVQAKPIDIWTLPAFFPVMFELTILFSAFTTLFGLLALMGLPRWNHPLFASKRFAKFSDDGFFVCIEARDPKFSQEGTKALLEKAGGKNIELVEDEI
jgi:hypothetical protein